MRLERREARGRRTHSPGRRRLILHIGPHKTGSTTIQRVLTSAPGVFRNAGFSTFPASKNIKEASAFGFILTRGWFDGDFMKHPVAKKFVQEVAEKNSNWLISTEVLDEVSDVAQTDRLKELFAGYNVKIVAFYRDPLSHIRSYWAETSCDNRYVKIFPEYLKDTAEKIFNGTLADGQEMTKVLKYYERSFGKRSIVLVDFDGVMAAGKTPQGVLLEDIAKIKLPPHGIPKHLLAPGLRLNQKGITTAVNIWASSHNRGLGSLAYCHSLQHDLVQRLTPRENQMLQDCDQVIDLDEVYRELRSYFSSWLESSGYPLLYSVKSKERKKFECRVVREEFVGYFAEHPLIKAGPYRNDTRDYTHAILDPPNATSNLTFDRTSTYRHKLRFHHNFSLHATPSKTPQGGRRLDNQTTGLFGSDPDPISQKEPRNLTEKIQEIHNHLNDHSHDSQLALRQGEEEEKGGRGERGERRGENRIRKEGEKRGPSPRQGGPSQPIRQPNQEHPSRHPNQERPSHQPNRERPSRQPNQERPSRQPTRSLHLANLTKSARLANLASQYSRPFKQRAPHRRFRAH